MTKPLFERVYEPDEDIVHYAPFPGADAVTLCGITDFMGRCHERIRVPRIREIPTRIACRAIVAYCQGHRVR